MTWRPATQEPDLLDEAIDRAIRATILPHVALGPPPGEEPILLEDGRRLRLGLRAEATRNDSHLGRAVVVYDVAGHAAVARSAQGGAAQWLGYELRGTAIIDVTTQAFLLVEHRLAAVGDVAR